MTLLPGTLGVDFHATVTWQVGFFLKGRECNFTSLKYMYMCIVTFLEKNSLARFHTAKIQWKKTVTCLTLKVKDDHRSKFSNLSNWKEEAWKQSGLQQDSNPWPPRYRCDALPTELWSHTLEARSIYWVHIFPCSEVMWSLYEIIHICTAVVDESEGWSSQ